MSEIDEVRWAQCSGVSGNRMGTQEASYSLQTKQWTDKQQSFQLGLLLTEMKHVFILFAFNL